MNVILQRTDEVEAHRQEDNALVEDITSWRFIRESEKPIVVLKWGNAHVSEGALL